MWFLLGILSGLFSALLGAVGKRVMAKGISQYLAAFAYSALAIPFLILALFWLDLTTVNSTFWWAAIVAALLGAVIPMVLLMKALKIGELSSTMPFLAFTPVFLIFTSRIMLGELLSSMGIAGVLCVFLGSYVIGAEKGKKLLGPLKKLANNKAAQLVLFVAFLYSFAANFAKIAIENSNPITYSILVQIISALILIPFVWFGSKDKFAPFLSRWKLLLPIGLLTALVFVTQMTAMSLTMVSFAISLKRTSVVFSVILGIVIFKERENKGFKLAGAALMMMGALLIAIS